MTKTTELPIDNVEVADILREHMGDYQEQYALLPEHYKIVHNLLNCRTSYLGGHVEKCDHCGTERIAYNSCRDRHCPKCQSMPRERWLEARKSELLPVKYFHSVFTLPHDLNTLILFNKKSMLDILFKAVSETLLTFGKNPENGFGGKLGFISILHTWDQLLKPHFHLHCLIPEGAVTENGARWISCKNDYLFNEEALAIVFRGKFINYMMQAYKNKKLIFPGTIAPFKELEKFKELINTLYSKKWVVYVKEPIKQPEYVLEYLGRYTHRVAISNHRIKSLKDGNVTFTCKNRETNQTESVTINALEFIRRFLLHALPKRFVRIRHFGFLANRNKKTTIKEIRRLLGQTESVEDPLQSVEEMMLKLTGVDITRCPCCKKGEMLIVQRIPERTGASPARSILPLVLRKPG